MTSPAEVPLYCEPCAELTGQITAHLYPADWIFGGANGSHPGTDPRYRGTVYTYFDDQLNICAIRQTALCDGQAVTDFRVVRAYGDAFRPVYVQAERPDGSVEGLRYTFDWRTGAIRHTPAPGGDDGSGS